MSAKADRTASSLIEKIDALPPARRAEVEDFVDLLREREVRDHNAWVRDAVEAAVRDADDPAVARISNDEVSANWRRQREALIVRAGERKA